MKNIKFDTSVELCGLRMDNPIIPASGTFGYGYEFAEWYDINMLGTFSFKGTTQNPRFGNPTPRIAEAPMGMLNAVGLQNPGVEKVLSHELAEMEKVFHKPVMANVGGFSVEEYAYTAEKLAADSRVGWLEVNISCPNVHGGGISFGTDAKLAAQVTSAVRKVTDKPVIMKLSPNVTDITEIARAVEAAGAFAVTLECIPSALAAEITAALKIVTIGVGAGPSCDAQWLVMHDLLGLNETPPPFAKKYAALAETVRGAFAAYVADVAAGRFPA